MCQALGIHVHTSYLVSITDGSIRTFIEKIGYNGVMTRLGLLTRPKLRREWNFYFNYIRRAFTIKCRNFNAITQTTQQIWYSLIFDYNYDFNHNLIHALGDRIKYYSTKVYFPKFLDLIFRKLYPNVEFADDVDVPRFKLTRGAFTDLLSEDAKKVNLAALVIPTQVRHVLH